MFFYYNTTKVDDEPEKKAQETRRTSLGSLYVLRRGPRLVSAPSVSFFFVFVFLLH